MSWKQTCRWGCQRKRQYKCMLLIMSIAMLVLLACEREAEQLAEEVDEVPSLMVYISTMMSPSQRNVIQNYLEEGFQDSKIEVQWESIGTLNPRYVLDELLNEENSGGREPDIMIDYPHQTEQLFERGIAGLDMHSFLNMYHELAIEPAFIEQLRGQWDGSLYGLPFLRSVHAVRYDKSFFEEVGLERPSEMLTWDELVAIDQSIKLHTDRARYALNTIIETKLLLTQLSITFEQLLSYEADHVAWQKIVPVLQMYRPERRDTLYRTSGGYSGAISLVENVSLGSPNGEWDFVAFPTFDDVNRVGPDQVTDVLLINPHTPYMDEAAELVRGLLSIELQSELSRVGLGSPLAHDEVHAHFGRADLQLNGKNLPAFFVNDLSPTGYVNEMEQKAERIAFPHLTTIYYMASPRRELMLQSLEHSQGDGSEEKEQFLLLERAVGHAEWSEKLQIEELIEAFANEREVP